MESFRQTAIPSLRLPAHAAMGCLLPVFPLSRRCFVSSRPTLPRSATAFPNRLKNSRSIPVPAWKSRQQHHTSAAELTVDDYKLFASDEPATPPNPNPKLRSAFPPAVFKSIRKLWFSAIANDNALILPPLKLAEQWLSSSAEFDKLCREKLAPLLKLIQSENPAPHNLLASVGPLKPLDWLSLILLLDQATRNLFHGNSAKPVFTVFDPLALQIATQAIMQGIPSSPEVRYHAAYRWWFYLPLQHSESREMNELSIGGYAKIFTDMRELMDSSEESLSGDEKVKRIRTFLLQNRKVVDVWEVRLIHFAQKDKAILDRFGRYPQRNEALGRKWTKEETRYISEW